VSGAWKIRQGVSAARYASELLDLHVGLLWSPDG
jgi:hypothetical protein